ncbi:MAG: hypothetical protein ACJAVK_002507 [Akkermansiaceae bacterium]|jgi:hypothetical protein
MKVVAALSGRNAKVAMTEKLAKEFMVQAVGFVGGEGAFDLEEEVLVNPELKSGLISIVVLEQAVREQCPVSGIEECELT